MTWFKRKVTVHIWKSDEPIKKRKKYHWYQRRDYIVSDTGVNISMRLLDQILHSSRSRWWYWSELELLLLRCMGCQLALWKVLPLLVELCRFFFSYLYEQLFLFPPLRENSVLEVKVLLIADLLPADRSTEIHCGSWWRAVICARLDDSYYVNHCFKYQSHLPTHSDRG